MAKKPITTPYLSISVPLDNPLGRTQASGHAKAMVHRLVLYDKIGPGKHSCHWCGRSIYWEGASGNDLLVTDHLDHNKWNNESDNLVPSCLGCNTGRAKREDFLIYCPKGHSRTPENTWIDYRNERKCRVCNRLKANRIYHRKRRAAGYESVSKYEAAETECA